jgi:hypothetical protein
MENMEEWRKILLYILIFWGASGVIIALGTWILMLVRKQLEFRLPRWYDILEWISMMGMLTILSYCWIGLNIYENYRHKKRMEKIKEGKWRDSDLF